MTRPLYRATHLGTAVTASPAVGGIPTGTSAATNDVMIAALHIEASTAITLGAVPAGWTQIGSSIQNGTTQFLAVFRRVFQTGDTAPSFTWTGTTVRARVVTYSYQKVDPLNPIGAFAFATISSTTLDSPSITVTTTGSTRLSIVGSATATTFTPSNTMVERDDANTGGTTAAHFSHFMADMEGLAAGHTGTRSATAAATGAACLATIVLNPSVPETIGILQVGSSSSSPVATGTITLPNPLTAGSTLIAHVGSEGSTTTASRITDVDYSSGNLDFVKDVERADAGGRHASIWRYANNQQTTDRTITARRGDGSTNTIRIHAIEYWGIGTDAPDATGNNGGLSTTPSVTTSAMTAGDRLITAIVVANGTAYPTLDPDYSFRQSGNTNVVGYSQDRFLTATAGQTDTISGTFASTDWVAVCVVYKPAASTTPISASDTHTLSDVEIASVIAATASPAGDSHALGLTESVSSSQTSTHSDTHVLGATEALTAAATLTPAGDTHVLGLTEAPASIVKSEAKTHSDTHVLGTTDGATIASTMTPPGDTHVLGVTESTSRSQTSTHSDTGTVTGTEGTATVAATVTPAGDAHVLGMTEVLSIVKSEAKSATDTAALGLTESTSRSQTSSHADSAVLGATEALTAAATLSTSDSAAIGSTESQSRTATLVPAGDSHALGSVESAVVYRSSTFGDTAALGWTESVSIVVIFAVSDTNAMTGTETTGTPARSSTHTDTNALGATESVSRSQTSSHADSAVLGALEASSGAATLSATDTAALGVTESAFVDESGSARSFSDAATIGMTEGVAVAANITPLTDTLSLGTTDGATLAKAVGSTDTGAIGSVETAGTTANLTGSDTNALGWTETTTVFQSVGKTSTDTHLLGFVEQVSIEVRLSVADTSSMLGTEGTSSVFAGISVGDDHVLDVLEAATQSVILTTGESSVLGSLDAAGGLLGWIAVDDYSPIGLDEFAVAHDLGEITVPGGAGSVVGPGGSGGIGSGGGSGTIRTGNGTSVLYGPGGSGGSVGSY